MCSLGCTLRLLVLFRGNEVPNGKGLKYLECVSKSASLTLCIKSSDIYWQENIQHFYPRSAIHSLFFPSISSFSFFSQWSRGWVRTWKQPQSMHKTITLLFHPHIAVLRACEFSPSISQPELCCQCDVLYFDPKQKQPTHQPRKTHLCTSIDVILAI